MISIKQVTAEYALVTDSVSVALQMRTPWGAFQKHSRVRKSGSY